MRHELIWTPMPYREIGIYASLFYLFHEGNTKRINASNNEYPTCLRSEDK